MEHGKSLASTDGPLGDCEGVCQKIRAAIEPVRAQSVSLHDESGDLLWLTESSMGPDEHNAVREAFDAFANGAGPTVVAYDLGDNRSAVLFRVTNATRVMAGAAMVIVDTRILKQDPRGPAQLMTQKLLGALGDFATLRRRMAPAVPPPPPATTRAAPAVTDRADTRSRGNPKNVSPEIDRLHAALRRSPIALYVQWLMPLTKGSRLKRYEVLLRSKSAEAPNAAPQAMLKSAVENGLGSMIDRRVVTELISWLVRNPAVWQDNGVMFSVNLTKTALHDEHFMKFVGLCLSKAALPNSLIAFEVDVPTAINPSSRISEVADALFRLGCPLVLDDFALRTECFALLRLPGVKIIKLAPAITKQMRTDRVSQAAITGLVQMARVLGMHTVAKRTETGAEQEWLTALGVDFVQSNAISPPVTIDSLAKPEERGGAKGK
jgi:EAL domain-containing protein (putative c-di-GMP-specific phosphodiesterase class I)